MLTYYMVQLTILLPCRIWLH